mmetsp:Transcript_21242/g.38767  ORF Transcript_21242/g.38767 Transcript_21242/m.38767 type:complete len:90 (-) Transcript_21242:25-294(-)
MRFACVHIPLKSRSLRDKIGALRTPADAKEYAGEHCYDHEQQAKHSAQLGRVPLGALRCHQLYNTASRAEPHRSLAQGRKYMLGSDRRA